MPGTVHWDRTYWRDPYFPVEPFSGCSCSRFVIKKAYRLLLEQFFFLKKILTITGELVGLKSSSIQAIDVEDTNKTCHITNELGLLGMKDGTVIDGNIFRIDETLINPMIINETFQFSIRAIGSRHVQDQRVDQFDGVATFVLEQNKKTIGAFSASSFTKQWRNINTSVSNSVKRY